MQWPQFWRPGGRAGLVGPVAIASGERHGHRHRVRRAGRLVDGYRYRHGLRRPGTGPACRPSRHKACRGPLASPAIVGTLATSAAMNAFAFASHADGLMIVPAIGLGFAVPALVYALTKTGAVLFFARGSQ